MFFFVSKRLVRTAVGTMMQNQKANLSRQAKLKSLKVPGFKVNSSDIFVITEPAEFHSKLLVSTHLSGRTT